ARLERTPLFRPLCSRFALGDLQRSHSQGTALPAKQFGLKHRGEVHAGCFADLTIFDPDKIGTASNYLKPDQSPQRHRARVGERALGRAEWGALADVRWPLAP